MSLTFFGNIKIGLLTAQAYGFFHAHNLMAWEFRNWFCAEHFVNFSRTWELFESAFNLLSAASSYLILPLESIAYGSYQKYPEYYLELKNFNHNTTHAKIIVVSTINFDRIKIHHSHSQARSLTLYYSYIYS